MTHEHVYGRFVTMSGLHDRRRITDLEARLADAERKLRDADARIAELKDQVRGLLIDLKKEAADLERQLIMHNAGGEAVLSGTVPIPRRRG